MKSLSRFLLILIVFTSCGKSYQEYSYEGGYGYDPDAKKFMDSAGITILSDKNAINTFVVQLKNDSLWSKFIAIYPMMGGTEQSVKWNLKNPTNSDAAFRLTMHGSPVYSASGVLFPTNPDFADTHLADSMLTYNSSSIAYYSKTQNTVNGYDMGCVDTSAPYNEFAIYNQYDASNWFGYFKWGYKPANTVGLFQISSTANDIKRYDNGVITSSKGSAPVYGNSNLPILIGTVAASYSGGQRQCALATIGKGFTDQDAITFNTIAHTFETLLHR